MNRNTYLALFLFFMSVSILFSGTVYWDHGEIVRGTKINYALDEKFDISGETFFQLEPTGSFATASAEIGTVYQNATGSIIYLSTGTTWLKLLATTTFDW